MKCEWKQKLSFETIISRRYFTIWNVDWKHIFHKLCFKWKYLKNKPLCFQFQESFTKSRLLFRITFDCFQTTSSVVNFSRMFSNYKFMFAIDICPYECFQTTYLKYDIFYHARPLIEYFQELQTNQQRKEAVQVYW